MMEWSKNLFCHLRMKEFEDLSMIPNYSLANYLIAIVSIVLLDYLVVVVVVVAMFSR
jgi:hypothetical protein